MTISRAHSRWILRGLGDEELVVLPFDAPRPARYQLLPAMFPVGYLRRWLQEPDARRTLLAIFTTLYGSLDVFPSADDEVLIRIEPALRQAFERYDLIVLTPRRANASPPGPDLPPPSKPPSQPPAQKTFIEIVLLDDNNKPVAGEPYEITLPDGSIRKGSLDQKGFAREDNLDPGVCDVRFPKIDGREWGTTRKPVPK
ncbi:MAG: hypothetical protein U0359_08185 [Byssovorax sp.]